MDAIEFNNNNDTVESQKTRPNVDRREFVKMPSYKPFILEILILSHFQGKFVGLKFYSGQFFVKVLDLKISSIFQGRKVTF